MSTSAASATSCASSLIRTAEWASLPKSIATNSCPPQPTLRDAASPEHFEAQFCAPLRASEGWRLVLVGGNFFGVMVQSGEYPGLQDAANVWGGVGKQDPDSVGSGVDDVRQSLNTVVGVENLDADALVIGKRAGRFQETAAQA